ncbi:unnamed protein product [Rhizoctonia solani]|uniref:Uncharacterized protein n=1 Tax=Rhizoctonia solani TaxID=456999 RepID=A0A8H2WB63_9AGAM|nr:unnamed protein product [Rhizoctonia solani]
MKLLLPPSAMSRLLRILLWAILFISPTWSYQSSMTAIGISIDDHDRFTIAVSGVETLSRGYFEVRESLSVDVTLSESSAPHLKIGRFWSTLASGGENAPKLAGAVFSALKTTSETTDMPYSSFRACVTTSPLALSTSQKEFISSALKEVFGCVDDSFVIRESHAIISALNIESSDLEDTPIAVVVPNGFTYILEEDYSTVVVVETFPPPLDLDLVFSKYDVKEIIVVQDSGELQLGQTYGTNKIHIRYEPSDIIARGAATVAEHALPGPPASVLPLALGVVLHGAVSHIVIPMFSVLPRHAKLILTTVHDNQQTAVIEVREGSRARASDNLFLTKLHLEGIPPAPAGTISIEVALSAEDYPNRITVEAVETRSGRKATTTVQRDEPVYPEDVLDEHQAAREKYAREDAELRENLGKRLSRETQPMDAVQLFVKPPRRHEEL